MLLSSDLFKTGFSFKSILGPVWVIVLASLIPAIYIIWDFVRNKVFNPVTMVVAAGAIVQGMLSFWQVSGWQYALKDSYTPAFIALVMLVSLIINRPFFTAFIRFTLNPDTPERKSLFDRYLNHPAIKKMLFWGTVVIFIESTINAGVNFLVHKQLLTDPFGTDAFIKQLETATATMRPISIISTLIGYGLAFYMLNWASKNEFGDKASPLEDHFWEALEQHHNPQPTSNFAD